MIGRMAPKRRALRRPGAAAPPPAAGPARRRPAAREPPERRGDSQKKLVDVEVAALGTMGTIYLKDALYYGRPIEICGHVQGVRTVGPEVTMDLKVSGATDDALLRALSGREGKMIEVHICDEKCSQVLTGEALVHGRHYEKVSKEDKEWFGNMEAVVPGREAEDELRGLRGAVGEMPGVEVRGEGKSDA